MGSAYKAVEDKHLDHSKDNSKSHCFFCRKNDWAEPGNQARKQRRERKRQRKINELEEELEQVEQDLEDSFLPTVKLVNRRENLKRRLEVLRK